MFRTLNYEQVGSNPAVFNYTDYDVRGTINYNVASREPVLVGYGGTGYVYGQFYLHTYQAQGYALVLAPHDIQTVAPPQVGYGLVPGGAVSQTYRYYSPVVNSQTDWFTYSCWDPQQNQMVQKQIPYTVSAVTGQELNTGTYPVNDAVWGKIYGPEYQIHTNIYYERFYTPTWEQGYLDYGGWDPHVPIPIYEWVTMYVPAEYPDYGYINKQITWDQPVYDYVTKQVTYDVPVYQEVTQSLPYEITVPEYYDVTKYRDEQQQVTDYRLVWVPDPQQPQPQPFSPDSPNGSPNGYPPVDPGSPSPLPSGGPTPYSPDYGPTPWNPGSGPGLLAGYQPGGPNDLGMLPVNFDPGSFWNNGDPYEPGLPGWMLDDYAIGGPFGIEWPTVDMVDDSFRQLMDEILSNPGQAIRDALNYYDQNNPLLIDPQRDS